MDLENIKSNLLALRQLYGLLRNDRDGVSNLNSDGVSFFFVLICMIILVIGLSRQGSTGPMR